MSSESNKQDQNTSISMNQSGWQIAGNVTINNYNVARDLNINSETTKPEYLSELEKLKNAILELKEFPKENNEKVQQQLDKALSESRKPKPDKKKVVDHLNNASKILEVAGKTVASVLDFAKAIGKVVTWVGASLN
jgi:hypothetical protein